MKIAKLTEMLVNVAIITVAILFSVFMIQRYRQGSSARALRRAAVGKQVSIPLGGTNSTSEQRLVIAIREGCSYCEASLPFYKRLAASGSGSSTKIVIVMPDSQAVEDVYLARAGLQSVAHFAGTPLAQFYVDVTPTILLVDPHGKVQKEWTGQLASEEEIQVERSLNP